MWLILQQDKPSDFVLGTGETHSVKEFLEEAFNYLNLDYREYIEIDPIYFRPTEVENLRSDSTKARKILNWSPKITFKDLVKIMVDYDLEILNITPPREGKKIIQEKGLEWNKNHTIKLKKV